MPYIRPSQSEVHVDRPLTNVAVAYMQSADRFVAGRAFPRIPVANQSDKYWVIPRDAWYRDEFAERADGDESAGANFQISTDNYSCTVRALHYDIGEQMRANADTPIAPDMMATQFLTNKGLISQENHWAENYFKTGKWTFEADGASARFCEL